MNVAGRLGILGDFTMVGSFEHHLDGTIFHADQFQHRGERHAGPLGIAHGTKFPEYAFGLRDKERTAVSRALDRRSECFRRKSAKIVVA
jgi:hypothetical protein